ncbi:MAG TPA: hypothetical protein VGW10_02020 [Solirubrobacteraceae bacterium]|nr:hypothetical protein [Solirubrobacteraceae bacterium]
MRRSLLFLAAWAAVTLSATQAFAHENRQGADAAFAEFFDDSGTAGLFAAGLQDPHPLTGTGSNIRIVANVPLDGKGANAASDIELAGDHAYVGSYGEGMVIINITNPRAPQRVGAFPCRGGQNDVQLQPGSNPQYATLAIESPSNECHPNNEGFVLIDISDKANPREVAFVGQTAEEGGIEDGAHNTTMDWPYLYVDQYLATHGERGKIDIFDLRKLIANPNDRAPIAVLDAPGGGAHDLQVDHRPDGKALAYAASIGFTDVIDVTDPTKPRFLQRLSAAEHGVGISHGAEPNHDRTILIETDEYGGGDQVRACGGGSDSRVPPSAAGQINTASPGAVHLLRLAPDGRIRTLDPAGTKTDQIGAYNIPVQNNAPTSPDGCTSHVFWQAPDENRITIAWYGRGTRIFDFSNPNAPVELGHFIPDRAETWAAKPHMGYIFTSDTVRGMDVLEYTGEDCARWPTTSGAAEIQRARYQGTSAPSDAPRSTPPGCGGKPTNAKPVPLERTEPDSRSEDQGGGGPGSGSSVGGYRFVRAVRVPRNGARFQTLRLQILNRSGKRVAIGRYRVRSGRRVRLQADIGGPVGRYAYRVTAGRRVLRSGTFRIRRATRVRVPGATARNVRIARLRT